MQQSGNERIQTGVSGLDMVLNGGVFEGGIYIVQGEPGAGKTILGNQICFHQAAQGRTALYVTLLAESHARMIGHMRRMTFFDEAAIPDRMSYLGAFRTLEDDGLRGLLDVVRREVRTRKASILVLDGLITVHETARSDLELKKFIHELQTQAGFSNCTMFLLTSVTNAREFQPEHTMVDGLIELKMTMHGRRAERELYVRKLRGSWSLGGRHSYRITNNGFTVFPRIEALLEVPSDMDAADGPRVSSGIAGLDRMLDGGIDTHSVTLCVGASGTGKTTAGLQFLAATSETEAGLWFGFHENPMALTLKARQLGLPIDLDRVHLLWRPQTEAILDEVAHELLNAIRNRGIRRLVIDGLDGFSKLTDEANRVASFLPALCNELRALGVTTLATAELPHAGMHPLQPLAGINLTGFSAVAENIIALRMAALRSESHRLMTVLKSRDHKTDLRMRRFEIAAGGIQIDDDYVSAEKILSWLSAQVPHVARDVNPVGV